MQDDKTTASEVTTKHRNSSLRRGGSDPGAPLLTVPSSDSTQSSSVSQRRLMRLSEKMSIVKQRYGGALSPTQQHLPPQASPTYSVPRNNNNNNSRKNGNGNHRTTSQRASALARSFTEEEEEKYRDAEEEEEEEEEEEDTFSEFSTPHNPGVGIISPVADTPRSEDNGKDDPMDRIESQRVDDREASDFLRQPALQEDKTQHTKHNRIPGGAAAKLMLLGPQKSMDEDGIPTPRPSPDSSTGSEKQNQLQAALDRARNQVKSQFNMRVISESHAETNESSEPVDIMEYRRKLVEESSNLFDRNEVFYETAEAAIQALLTAKNFIPSDTQSVYSRGSLGGTHSNDGVSVAASVASAFHIAEDSEINNFESVSRKDFSDDVMPWKAQQLIESLRDEMQDPTPTLAHLLQTIATPPEGEAPDLGKTVRRKNACGALRVLTAQPTNRIPLAWTTGVLPALTSVLADTGTEGAHVTYPDKRHRHEFEVARDRAISCLVNLAIPRENRIPIFHAPNLVHWLVAMILEGRGQPRKGACAVLAYLAKTPDNRLLMTQVPRLMEALTKVLKRRPPRMEYPEPSKQISDSSREQETDEDEDDLSDDDQDNTTAGHTNTTAGSEHETVHSERQVVKTESVLTEPSKFLSVSSSYSNQSGVTQRLAGARSPVELNGYDETADELLREARNFAFAALSNLVKEKDNAFHFARDAALVKVMSEIAVCQDSQTHVHAVKFLACLTRHRLNSKVIVFRRRSVVPALVEATASTSEMARLYACYGLQNLSQDKSCRQELAICENLLVSLCERARGATDQEAERLAALSALKNLTDEPANLIPMSNTTDCIATLMHLAHGRQEGVTPLMQYRACDALATLSHWLRKIATSGQALTDAKMGKSSNPNSKELFVPSLRVVTVNQWQ